MSVPQRLRTEQSVRWSVVSSLVLVRYAQANMHIRQDYGHFDFLVLMMPLCRRWRRDQIC